MKSIEVLRKETDKAAKSLNQSLIDLSRAYEEKDDMGEGDFQEFVMKQIVPVLTESEDMFGLHTLDLLELCWTLADVNKQFDLPSIEVAIYKMNTEGLSWVIDHICTLKSIAKMVDRAESPRDYDSYIGDMEQLEEGLKEALWERTQIFESKLTETA